MSDLDIETLKNSVKTSTDAINNLIDIIDATHRESFTAMEAFGKDMVSIQEEVTGLNHTINGNGKEGLKEKIARVLVILEGLKACNDTAVTTSQLLEGRVKRIENRMARWAGIFIGVNTLWTVLLAGISLWFKLKGE